MYVTEFLLYAVFGLFVIGGISSQCLMSARIGFVIIGSMNLISALLVAVNNTASSQLLLCLTLLWFPLALGRFYYSYTKLRLSATAIVIVLYALLFAFNNFLLQKVDM